MTQNFNTHRVIAQSIANAKQFDTWMFTDATFKAGVDSGLIHGEYTATEPVDTTKVWLKPSSTPASVAGTFHYHNGTDWSQTLTSAVFWERHLAHGGYVPETALSIKTKYESNADTNAFSDAEKAKLAGLEGSHFKGTFTSESALVAGIPPNGSGTVVPVPGDYADVDTGPGAETQRFIFDDNSDNWVHQAGTSSSLTAAQVKTLYESNASTNAFDDNAVAAVSAIGIAAGQADLDTFPGGIISDNTTVKNALSELEAAVEAAGGLTYTPQGVV